MRNIILVMILLLSGGAGAQEQTVNIRTSLVSTFAGDRPNIRGDFRVGEKLSIGAEVGNQSYDDDNIGVKGYSGGLYATLYTKGVFTRGWMVDFGIIYSKLTGELTTGGVTHSGDATNVGFRVLGGYHWFWNPFNMSLGFGYASNSEDKINVRDGTGAVIGRADLEPVALAADFSIGLTF